MDDVECTMKRNIIHLLCLHPMSHSELVKLLPDDVCSSALFTLFYQFAENHASLSLPVKKVQTLLKFNIFNIYKTLQLPIN